MLLDLLEDVTDVIRETLGSSTGAIQAAGLRIDGVVAELEALERSLLTEFADFDVLFRGVESARTSMPTVAEEDIAWIAQRVVQCLVDNLSSEAAPSGEVNEGMQEVLSATGTNATRGLSRRGDSSTGQRSPAQQEDVDALDDHVHWARSVQPADTDAP